MATFSADDCAAYRAPGRTIRRLDKLMTMFVESRLGETDLSYAQWVALKVVRDAIATNAGELARELGITTGATTRLIDQLETRGLLARERGEDRRVVQLTVTEPARSLIAAMHVHIVDAWNEVLVDFTQDEADTMVRLLVKLLGSFERLLYENGPITEAAE